MAVPLSVRKATPDDAMGVFKLAASMHAETDFKHCKFNPEKTFNALMHWIQSEGNVIFITVADKEPTGLLVGNLTTQWYSSDLYAIEKLFYVDPAHRGTRAAFYLVRAFIQWGYDNKAKHIAAGIASGSGDAGARLYQKFGMKNLGSNFSLHT